jgi:hypothetical protein
VNADFRSDTLTRPTPAMREAMASADVGDDVYGEDPTIRELEEFGAATLGLGAAMFVPSGTMANQCAIHVHCRPGDEVICEERSHVHLFEGGGIARWTGASVRLLAAERGFPEPEAIEAALSPDDVHRVRSRLLVLENTQPIPWPFFPEGRQCPRYNHGRGWRNEFADRSKASLCCQASGPVDPARYCEQVLQAFECYLHPR